MPHRVQMWNSQVRVPNTYLDTSAGSLTCTCRAPPGLEVHTPPCLVQNEQVQARAGISAGSGSQTREKEMFPQWHLPWINKGHPSLGANIQSGTRQCFIQDQAQQDTLHSDQDPKPATAQRRNRQ